MRKYNAGLKALVFKCASLKKGENVLILSDRLTCDIAKGVEGVLKDIAGTLRHEELLPFKMHGEEPSGKIAKLMAESDVIFCLTNYSIAHTAARKNANKKGARFLSLPMYSSRVLASGAMFADFSASKTICEKISKILSSSKRAEVHGIAGTEMVLDISGRVANSAPGVCDVPGSMASPPDIEVNIAPIESGSNGVIVVDGSIPIPELGIVSKPVVFFVENGSITGIKGGKEAGILRKMFDCPGNEKKRILGELGLGLNPNARLCGRMLEDEGTLGTVHFGFGSNNTIGGKNKVPFHVDTVIKKASLIVDGQTILKKGELCV